MRSVKDFRSASGKAEALDWLDQLGSDAQVLAGGTDVMIQYPRGELSPEVLLHIERIDELRGIESNGRIQLGALTTHSDLAQSPLAATRFPALSEAARTVGGWQTQAVGTVGGNLCNASPAADLVPPLLVADAQVTLESVEQQRTMPLRDFIQGRRQTARAPNELLTGISVEPISDNEGEVYLKVGRRGAMEVAIVGLAARLAFDPEGTIRDARVAVCSVAPKPYRATAAETALIGTRADKPNADAGELLAESTSPIDDARSLASYRMAVMAPLLVRAIAICQDRAA
ncbi:MAG: FAD binding domain-containing protein [Acidimicrobiia bacterium]